MKHLIIALFAVTACQHATDKNLTASEHRELASAHEAKAEAEREQFDPSQTRATISRSPFTDMPDGVVNQYNPTAEHLAAADREMARASQHSKEAAKLEAFEATACQALPKEQRSACPLLASQVTLVQNDRKGVRLTIKPSADAGAIEKRLQCHLAYAKTVGFEKPTCPLFVNGMSIELVAPRVIALHGDTAEVAQALQAQAHRIFVGDVPTPISMGETRGAP